MNKILAAFFLLFSCGVLFGQHEKAKGTVTTKDTANLSILNIYPELFPDISVVFKAEKSNGEPVWNLTKDKMIVNENKQHCDVVSLEQVSKNKPINIGIVIDHSGSMQMDDSQLYNKKMEPLYFYDGNLNLILPKGYISPIDNAKMAVKDFVRSFNSGKDFISVVGFSSIVDKRLPLTQDTFKIKNTVDSMKAESATALYDAILTSIDEVKKSEGIKVLVVLTDGQDNYSKKGWIDVVEKANKERIPIFIIGLGDVNKDTLEMISKSTKGRFYYTQTAKALSTIYAEISKQVQAFYNLVYSSPNFSLADTKRQIELSFDIDSIYLVTEPSTLNIPTEVVTLIAGKEKQRTYMIYGGVGMVILISIGTLLFYYNRKKKSNPIINMIYPNPIRSLATIDYTSGEGNLMVINMKGQIVKTFTLSGDVKQFDFSDLHNGEYMVMIVSEGLKSNTVQVVKLQ